MQPHEIKPDTQLCTILGYNAQTGQSRKYFNKILKKNGLNATAIALNIADEHFDFTMKSVGDSKVDKMMIEPEFQEKAIAYCAKLNDAAKRSGRVDFIEVEEGKVKGYALTDEVAELFEKPEFADERIRFIARMMLIAHRWYGVSVDLDMIPLLIDNEEGK